MRIQLQAVKCFLPALSQMLRGAFPGGDSIAESVVMPAEIMSYYITAGEKNGRLSDPNRQ